MTSKLKNVHVQKKTPYLYELRMIISTVYKLT